MNFLVWAIMIILGMIGYTLISIGSELQQINESFNRLVELTEKYIE